MNNYYERKDKIDVPRFVTEVAGIAEKIISPSIEVKYEKIFKENPIGYLVYSINLRFPYLGNIPYQDTIDKKHGLTVKIYVDKNEFSISDKRFYEIYAYPSGLCLTTEVGENLEDALKVYFKRRLKNKIKIIKSSIRIIKNK